jgi:hypothetical protein
MTVKEKPRMTTQGPYANSPFPPQQGGVALTGQPDWAPQNGQQPNGAAQQPTQTPPKRREMSGAAAWTLTLAIPLAVLIGGYALLHLFFGKTMPTTVDAGKYVLEMADGDRVTCAFDAETPGGALDCASEDIPDANLTGGLAAAAQPLTQSTDVPADGVPALDTLTSGTVYEIDTTDGTLTIDMSDDDRILISGDGRELEITPGGVTVADEVAS